MISEAALGGYLLEEALANLLRRNGYRLLQQVSDDPQALRKAGHGLLVRGRGADHQADALGDLMVPAPFSLPVRLFVEGKNRRSAVDLRDVRNAHGIVHDVNEHYSTAWAARNSQPVRRYQYRYALFSTSGFKSEAQEYALAQQISLVDLSGPAFAQLRDAIDDAVRVIHGEAQTRGLKQFPLTSVRVALRSALDDAAESATAESSDDASQTIDSRYLARWSNWVAAELKAGPSGEGLILGFPRAPFILAMIPDNMEEFEAYVAESGPEIAVNIGFDTANGVGDWSITAVDNPDAFRLSFGVPGVLERWLLAAPDDLVARSEAAATALMSDISLFIEDHLIRLTFPPVELPVETNALQGEPMATNASDSSYLRRTLHSPRPRPRPERLPSEPTTFLPPEVPLPGWTPGTVDELMRRLDVQAPRQAKLIRAAAHRRGVLDRDEVYAIARLDQRRTLRGLTRPPRRIAGEMMTEGLLATDTPDPLNATYRRGVRASHFTIPPEIATYLA